MIDAEQVGLLMKSQPVGMHLNGQWAIPRTRNVEILEIKGLSCAERLTWYLRDLEKPTA
jgi:hypothetical protein